LPALRMIAAAAVLTGGLGAAVAAGAVAPAVAAPGPTRVSISVSDGVAQVRDRSSVAYVATVVNDGDAAVSGRLVLEVPAFARYRHAPAATVRRQEASWTVRVPAHSTVSRRAGVRIGTIPSGSLRVTSLASLFLGPVTAAPAVRAADSDRIAGVEDPPATPLPRSSSATPPASHRPAAADRHSDSSSTWAVVGLPIAGGVGLAGLAGLVWWRRRRAA